MFSIIKSIAANHSIASNGAHVFRKIISSPANVSVKHFTKKTAIRKRLGIPEPPKKPMNAFMRFVQGTRTSSSTNQRDLIKIAANQWKHMSEDEKQMYYKGYKEDLDQYLKDIEEYNTSIGQDKMMSIEKETLHELEHRMQNIEKRNFLNMLHELGKPKRPKSSYFQFRLDRLQAGDRDPHIKDKWAALDKTTRKKYEDESVKRKEIFGKLLIQWEAKMVAQGRGHLVRKDAMEKRKIRELEIEGIIKRK